VWNNYDYCNYYYYYYYSYYYYKCVCCCSDVEYYVSRGWNLSDIQQSRGQCRPGLILPPCDIDICRPSTQPLTPQVYSVM